MAKQFCQDQAFVKSVGLAALPASQRASQLYPRVGFVLSLYGSAQSCFRAYPQLPEDEKLFLVMERRLHGLPQINDPSDYAAFCMAELQTTCEWASMSTRDKFNAVCARTFAEEECGARGIPADMVLESSVIDQILDAVFKRKRFDLK